MQAKQYTFIVTKSSELAKYTTSKVECPHELRQGVVDEIQALGNVFLITSTLCGVFQIAINFVSLLKLFETLKDAENVLVDAESGKLDIEKRLNKIPPKLAEFEAIIQELSQANLCSGE